MSFARVASLGLLFVAGCTPRVPSLTLPAEATLAVQRDALTRVELRVMHSATFSIRDSQAMAGGKRRPTRRGATSVFLLQHPEHPPVLIDAGYGAATAEAPMAYPSRFTQGLLDIELLRTIADALPDVGLRPEDIAEVYLTHLHHDHVGGVADLPAAVLRGDAREWVEGTGKAGRFSGYEPEPYEGRTFAPLLFDDGPVGPIPRSADIFGDGTFIALPAPGHTEGHVMYLVHQPEGSWLYTGDAAWVDGNWKGGPVPKGYLARNLIETDWRQGVEALAAIRWFADQGVEVISGHEPENVRRYDTWPGEMRRAGAE